MMDTHGFREGKTDAGRGLRHNRRMSPLFRSPLLTVAFALLFSVGAMAQSAEDLSKRVSVLWLNSTFPQTEHAS